MKLLNRLTVGRRLAAGFSVLAALLLGVCALGTYNARLAQRMINEEVADIQSRIYLTHRLVELQQARDLHIRQIGLLVDMDQMQAQAIGARATTTKVVATIKQLLERGSAGEESALLNAVLAQDTR